MNEYQIKDLFKLLRSIDDSLKKLTKKRKPKRNKHKPPTPTYTDK